MSRKRVSRGHNKKQYGVVGVAVMYSGAYISANLLWGVLV
jgi:hypothetical protein